MTGSFWLHAGDSEPTYCPHCGAEYDGGDPRHGEAGTRDIVVGADATKTAQMYRCNRPTAGEEH